VSSESDPRSDPDEGRLLPGDWAGEVPGPKLPGARRSSPAVSSSSRRGGNFFQTPDRGWEGTDTSGIVDLNGVKLFDGILAAALGGGGFTEYLWDNPAMEGDEETGSPKVAQLVPATIGGAWMILGSGIYPEAAVP